MSADGLLRRKHTRLKGYDYSAPGAYFVTVNVAGNRCLLSDIRVGRGLAPAELRLSELGQVAEEELLALPRRYPGVTVEHYAIMPNHVHILFAFNAAGASPRPTGTNPPLPTLMQVVGAWKSITARRCNRARNTPGESFWQTSFYESVLQTEQAYQDARQYIDSNPARWAEDPYYHPQRGERR